VRVRVAIRIHVEVRRLRHGKPEHEQNKRQRSRVLQRSVSGLAVLYHG
jgi:hypothetical protein